MFEPYPSKTKRVGLYLKPFNVYKIKTLKSGSEKISKVTSLSDQRLLKGAVFLRKYKIDEIPQFFNILKGNMTFVGPRPNFEELVHLYPDEIKKIIFNLKPGLTDYATLKFINMDKSVGHSFSEKKYFDVIEPEKFALIKKYYLEKNFWLNIKLLLLTLLSLLKK